MTERNRFYLLILIMTGVSLAVGATAMTVLYRAAMDQLRHRLMENAQSQARLIEAVARFDAVQSKDYPQGAAAATITQMLDAHGKFRWIGRTGEFTIARREGDQIAFLQSRKRDELHYVSWDSDMAEPMRRALSGKSGAVIAKDYRGKTVLAAHEPVAEVDLGIVAKIDLAEVRDPFIRAGIWAASAGGILVCIASLVFLRISSPIVDRIQEQHAKLEAILARAIDGIITLDSKGRIESLNQAAERMFGHSEAELVGQNIRVLMPAAWGDVGRSSEGSSPNNEIRMVREVVGRRKNGSEFPVDLSISDFRSGGQWHVAAIVRDMTERKRAEQNSRLAAIGQMISTIAHESRNSLQRIQGGVEMLRMDLEDGVDPSEQLERIEKANDNLTKLYEELRQFAAPLKLQLATCDLRNVWQTAWTNLGHVRRDREATLNDQTNGLNLRLQLDEFRVEQVFRNLMENSLAACEEDVEISIVCRDDESEESPALCVCVRDNGPGLTDDQKEHVFEPFFTTKTKGTGLGMAISKRIIEAHKGSISVGVGDHGGAEFVIKLPRIGTSKSRGS